MLVGPYAVILGHEDDSEDTIVDGHDTRQEAREFLERCKDLEFLVGGSVVQVLHTWHRYTEEGEPDFWTARKPVDEPVPCGTESEET